MRHARGHNDSSGSSVYFLFCATTIFNNVFFALRLLFIPFTNDLKIDNLDKTSIPAKVVATFDVEHPMLRTANGQK